jgi:hypothetical protein
VSGIGKSRAKANGMVMFSEPKPESPPLRSIEDFRGDFGEIASLMEQSWAENNKPPLRYPQEFLRSCFEYPGMSRFLAPTIYHDGVPKAFVAGFPRRVRYRERELNIVLISFLTVAPECKKAGYGVVVWAELVKRARAAGFDGMVNYCVDGEAMNGMIMGCCKRLNMPVTHRYKVQYLTSLLFPKSAPCRNETSIEENVEALVTIGNAVADRTPLARVWSREEAEWQCTRFGAVVARLRTEGREGMLTGYLMQAADPNRTQCLSVEDVLWGSLDRERPELVRQFAAIAAAEGARLVSAPLLGYAEAEPFLAARFRHSPQLLHAYFTLWSGPPPETDALPSFYLDVF